MYQDLQPALLQSLWVIRNGLVSGKRSHQLLSSIKVEIRIMDSSRIKASALALILMGDWCGSV